MEGEKKCRPRCYKWCFVPSCTNTTRTTPEKIFVTIPRNRSVRKQWFTMARRTDAADVPDYALYCCEDHFSLEEDAENLMYYKMMGGPLRLKPGVLPRKFECQSSRFVTRTSLTRPAYAKRARMEIVAAASQSCDSCLLSGEENIDSTKKAILSGENLSQESVEENEVSQAEMSVNKSVQVRLRPHVRSHGTDMKGKPLGVNKGCSPLKQKELINTATSPLKRSMNVSGQHITVEQCVAPYSSSSNEEESEESECDSGSKSFSENEEDMLRRDKIKSLSIQRIKLIIEQYPRTYLGIPDDSMFLINILEKHSKVGYRDILLCLKKIRLNESFFILGNDFAVSESQACKIFKKNIPILSAFLKQLIKWPSLTTIQQQLPIPFRARYSNVVSIIDCFEIEIMKPTKSVIQALTWSEYKKCNTLKYLISATPDGLISFVSEGYGGRISDTALVEESSYMKNLQPGQDVMADRGFKHLTSMLHTKGCKLIHPPSVTTGARSSVSEVRESKQVASLRIHIERVIRRVREFQILSPHSCIHHSLIPYTDYFVVIACGLINMQGSIIK